jgi:L-amino acid N-acyltransferase YncA
LKSSEIERQIIEVGGRIVDKMKLAIDALRAEDWPQVKAIYQQGLETGNATFETMVPDWTAWNQNHRPDCRLVARLGQRVVAWAALSPVSKREVYSGVAEVSIYVAQADRGRGIGRILMRALIREAEDAGIWTLQASIFPENNASILLHERHGFRQIGRRQRIARLYGIWRDVVLMERRSERVGIDLKVTSG